MSEDPFGRILPPRPTKLVTFTTPQFKSDTNAFSEGACFVNIPDETQITLHQTAQGGTLRIQTTNGTTPDLPWNASPEEINAAIAGLWELPAIPWWNLWARFKRWRNQKTTCFRLTRPWYKDTTDDPKL